MADSSCTGDRLEKQLGLMDVYAICTGAMFASGFFLFPGIAAANAGPAVVLAYLASSLLMVRAMYSIAELSSAMPRAAGTYFFIHRSMGPLAGTIGGLGAWLVLVAKSAFALVGMGAYIALFFDIPIQPLAIALTVAFAVLNIFGAKETAQLQVWLVVKLVTIMTFFIAAGAVELIRGDVDVASQFTPFLLFGVEGFISTIGLVFISYAGLTKVSSAAEEIRDLDQPAPGHDPRPVHRPGDLHGGGERPRRGDPARCAARRPDPGGHRRRGGVRLDAPRPLVSGWSSSPR